MAFNLKQPSKQDKFGLIAEWMDPHASLLRQFYFFFYPFDSTIEIYEIKKNRIFLKRTKVKNLESEDIFIGNVVTVFARQFRLVGFANEMTKKYLMIKMMKTFVIIKPDGMNKKAKILKMILSNGLKIANLRMLKLTDSICKNLFIQEKESDSFLDLVKHLTSGPSIILELVGDNAVDKMRKIAGNKDPKIAKQEDPGSIIALWGGDEVQSAVYYSQCAELAAKEINFMFNNPSVVRDSETHTAVLESSTCCVVKPHIMREGKLGELIDEIEYNEYKITAMQMYYLDMAQAEEFYEIYKGVVVEFNDMVQELTSGGCVAMEIVGPHPINTPSEFRLFSGPSDPIIARKLRPETLRAHFGKNKIQNAVHVSDLASDGVLEVEYFFKVLV